MPQPWVALAFAALADEPVSSEVSDVPPEAVAVVETPEVAPTDADAPPRMPPDPQARVGYSNFVALRANPLGLVERLRLGYRHRLFRNDGVLFEKAYVDLGAEVTLAPTYAAGGARLEVQPLAILNLAATYEFIGYFGVLGAVMPVGSTQEDYWEDTLTERRKAGESYATKGSRLTLAATLQGKAGPIIVRDTVTGLRVDLDLRDGATLSYDATQDLVLPDGGWAVINDLDVGGLVKKAAIGVRYTYADALHGTGGPGDLPTHRVGPLFAWTFHDRPPGARFDKPTLLALVQWHAQHPWRSGQRQTAAYPLIAIAFTFEGDLWIGKR